MAKVTNLDDAIRGLRANTARFIDLNFDKIGDPGATALAGALKQNSSVEMINLMRNNIGDPGARALAGALEQNSSVKRIDLYDNKIGDPGATALAGALKQNSSVETIVLYGNKISPEVEQLVDAAVKHTPTPPPPQSLPPAPAPAPAPAPVLRSRNAPARPAWDQRGVAEAAWQALLHGKPSGTFVVRTSRSQGGGVVATITVVTPGGGRFNQRIVRAGDGRVQILNSKHLHASLRNLVRFYQNAAYFAQDVALDVPAKLVAPGTPSGGGGGGGAAADPVYEMFWRDGDGGGGAAADAEPVYGDLYDAADGGTAGQQKLYERVVGEGIYAACSPYNPLEELARTPVLPFADAVAVLRGHCGGGNIVADGEAALAYARRHPKRNTVQRAGGAALTVEDIAVVHLYTMETAFYRRLNQELEGYAEGATHSAVTEFLPITKLLTIALAKLPPLDIKLFRGVKLPYQAILKNVDGEDAKLKDRVLWKQVTSCTTTADVLKTANFLGEQTAGTVFQIIAVTGINIKDYSAIPGEDEVVLPPGTQFVVDKITPWKHGVTEVRLRQILPDEAAAGADSGSHAHAAAASTSIYEEVGQYMAMAP